MTTARSSFLPRLSLSGNSRDRTSILPTYHPHAARYATLRSNGSDYDLDELSPHPEDGLLPPDFRDPHSPQGNSTFSKMGSKRKPTGAINRRPSDASSAGSASKMRHYGGGVGGESVLFPGPPPPIAVSTVLYRDEEQRSGGYGQHYEDDEDDDRSSATGLAASWLPGTARRAISSVMWDRSDNKTTHNRGDRAGVVDRNSVWRSLARRERAVVADVQRFLQVQEESLSGGSSGHTGQGFTSRGRNGGGSQVDSRLSDGGSVTPSSSSGAAASMTQSRIPGRSVSFLEPVTRSGPGGEVIPVRQPRPKKLGISGARRGIAHSLAELANLKTEEEASLLSALSARKQALSKLRNLATRKDGITEELSALETDEAEPLGLELEELDHDHRGVCAEIQALEERLAGLKSRRRHLETRMDDLRNRREAGLSGYKNALKEVEDIVRGFLARPPVKPLDVEALTENNIKLRAELATPGGLEFMHLLPERRTIDMAREWWESEVAILETRRMAVDTEREALEEGIHVWDEVVDLVLKFEADLRQQMSQQGGSAPAANSQHGKGRGKQRQLTAIEVLKLQYEKINEVVIALEQRLGAAESKGWNLLIAAIGAELEAFREAARVNREMLKAVGVAVVSPDDNELLKVPANSAIGSGMTVSREDSGATTESHNSFHTTLGGGGSTMLPLSDLKQQQQQQQQLLDLPNNHEDERSESDNEVPPELLAMHDDEEHDVNEEKAAGVEEVTDTDRISARALSSDRGDSGDDVPHEFLVEQSGS